MLSRNSKRTLGENIFFFLFSRTARLSSHLHRDSARIMASMMALRVYAALRHISARKRQESYQRQTPAARCCSHEGASWHALYAQRLHSWHLAREITLIARQAKKAA